MDVEYKRLTKELLNDLQLLFQLSGKKITYKQIVKKYATQSFGEEYIGYLAYDNLKKIPIGFYGVLPVIAIYQGKDIVIAQSADTITHPDYRKRGLFKILAEKTYELCRSSSIELLFGIPNYNSFSGFVNQLGWNQTGRFVIFYKKIWTFPLNFVVNKFAVSQPIYMLYVRLVLWLFAKPFNNKKGSELPGEKFFIPWNRKYKEYKLNTHQIEVSIANVNLVISFKGSLKIGFYDPICKDLSNVLKKLQLIAFLTGCHKIVFQKLDCFCTPLVENQFCAFSKKEGLPFIQKRINKTSLDDSTLAINYLDFDTF
jgi:GNAT superfamily N-acetyltransferase